MRMIHTLLVSASLLLPLAAVAETIPVITVMGEATIDTRPDLAMISLGVTTSGASATKAMAANTAALNIVLAQLKAAGIEDRDLQTSNLSLSPNWVGYDSGSTPSISGYTANNMLTVRVRALDNLGVVLDAAITDGANTLNGLTFDLANSRPVMDEARKAAVADARARATLLVTAAGGTLGRIVTISESGGYTNPAPMFRSDAEAAAPVPVAAGQIGVTAAVSVTFEFSQ